MDLDDAARLAEGKAGRYANRAAHGLEYQAIRGARRGASGLWGRLQKLFGRRKTKHIVRIGIIGQPGSGKTRLLANLVLDRDELDVGVGINWQAEALHRLMEQSPTYEPTVLLEGTFMLRRLRGVSIPIQCIDTMGGLTIDRPTSATFSPEQRENFRSALRALDLLVLVVDPDLVFSDDSQVKQANLSEHVSVVLGERSITSLALVYSKVDAYGIQYGSCGRLLGPGHRKPLSNLTRRLQGEIASSRSGAIVPALALNQRFPDPAEQAIAEEVLGRTEGLWRSILLHGPAVPWQFNAYFVAGEPALPPEVRKVQHGVGFDEALNDFFGRVKQRWWPFWDAPS